jgi:cytochrome P450
MLLVRHPESQKGLKEELFTRFPNAIAVEPKKMIDLPMLDGVLKETVRMYPMIPGPAVPPRCIHVSHTQADHALDLCLAITKIYSA